MGNFALKIHPKSLYLDFAICAFKVKLKLVFSNVQGSLRYPECQEAQSLQTQEK